MSEFFKDEGSLPKRWPSYVRRPADDELLRLCREGRLCYVLSSRQSGKTSLVVRTRERLDREGVASVYIELSTVGSHDLTADQWYLSVLDEFRSQLELKMDRDLGAWWDERRHMTVVKRFVDFLTEEVLPRRKGRIVVFVDEIDRTRDLPFSSDDFFLAVRALHNARAMEPALNHLSFVFLGVASPSELIADPRVTPFNVGQAVELGDLDPIDARSVLLRGLDGASDPQGVLDRVLHWTDGHPRLTQSLCLKVIARARPGPQDVDAIVRETLLGAAGEDDSTLREVRRQVVADERRSRWLPLYRNVLRDRGPQVDRGSEEQARLRLVGLVKGAWGERLRSRNRVFREVFDGTWAKRMLVRDPGRRMARRVAATAAAVVVLVLGAWAVQHQMWRASARQELVKVVSEARAAVVLDALHRLATEHRMPAADLRPLLAQREARDVRGLFEGAASELPSEDQSPAILTAVAAAYPIFTRQGAENLQLIGAMAWALDYFPGRDAKFKTDALELREEMLEALGTSRSRPAFDTFEWIDIDGGQFEMGSPEGEGEEEERPRHEVTISPFRMLAHEVTLGEYCQFDTTPCEERSGEDRTLPVVNVTWYAAYGYAAWLGGRLPTEAEWEYAARAGCEHDYCDKNGSETTLDEVGFYYENSDWRLHPVKEREPNAWGLYDMYGNAWEWVADWYADYGRGAKADPWGPPIGYLRVLRGGSWDSNRVFARAAFRLNIPPLDRSDYVGFRVVCSSPISGDL